MNYSCHLQGDAMSSIQWGAWAGTGMAASNPLLVAKLQRAGLELVTPSVGLAALGKSSYSVQEIF